jgi:hypothetical protein
MRPVHELLRATAETKLKAARATMAGLAPNARGDWLRKNLQPKLGDIEPNRQPQATVQWKKQWLKGEAEGITLDVEQGIIVPLIMLRPANPASVSLPVAVIVSEGGKERILAQRDGEIQTLLKNGVAVCLPDVRGTGETAPDTRHGPSSATVSVSSTELMLGNTLLGARMKDLRTLVAYVASRQDLNGEQIAVWGDSSMPENPARLLVDELPAWPIGPHIQNQAEPLGGLLAILTALYDNKVRAIAVRGGLSSYLSMLDDSFTYIPGDVIVPGILEVGDIADFVTALSARPTLFVSLVDGRNRKVQGESQPVDVGKWLAERLRE